RSKQTWKPPRNATLPIPQGGAATPEVDSTIREAAQRYDIPEPFIRAVIEVESNYKPRALSYKGAMGLMQLMPGTAADMGVTSPYDPYQNIMGGTRFLRILANRFNGDIPKVLAAYHAGGSSVATAEGIPYQGTDGYVRKVLDHYYRLKGEAAAGSGQPATP
ncbi:MAG: lytic transglycosylase domain-containing protein, partial [Deltaproteobacteria bacterium]|nr:lytic transglycosylase domain-containing protein [Deltaproteobacteria bacterium]